MSWGFVFESDILNTAAVDRAAWDAGAADARAAHARRADPARGEEEGAAAGRGRGDKKESQSYLCLPISSFGSADAPLTPLPKAYVWSHTWKTDLTVEQLEEKVAAEAKVGPSNVCNNDTHLHPSTPSDLPRFSPLSTHAIPSSPFQTISGMNERIDATYAPWRNLPAKQRSLVTSCLMNRLSPSLFPDVPTVSFMLQARAWCLTGDRGWKKPTNPTPPHSCCAPSLCEQYFKRPWIVEKLVKSVQVRRMGQTLEIS